MRDSAGEKRVGSFIRAVRESKSLGENFVSTLGDIFSSVVLTEEEMKKVGDVGTGRPLGALEASTLLMGGGAFSAITKSTPQRLKDLLAVRRNFAERVVVDRKLQEGTGHPGDFIGTDTGTGNLRQTSALPNPQTPGKGAIGKSDQISDFLREDKNVVPPELMPTVQEQRIVKVFAKESARLSLRSAEGLGPDAFDTFVRAVDGIDIFRPVSVLKNGEKLRFGLDSMGTDQLATLAGRISGDVMIGQRIALTAKGTEGALVGFDHAQLRGPVNGIWRPPEGTLLILRSGLPDKVLHDTLAHELGHAIIGIRDPKAIGKYLSDKLSSGDWNKMLSEMKGSSMIQRKRFWDMLKDGSISDPAQVEEFRKYLSRSDELLADAVGFILRNPEDAAAAMPQFSKFITNLADEGLLTGKNVFNSASTLAPLAAAAELLDRAQNPNKFVDLRA